MYEREEYSHVVWLRDNNIKRKRPGMATIEPDETARSTARDLWVATKVQWELFRDEDNLYATRALVNRREPSKTYSYSNSIYTIQPPILVNCEHPKDSPPRPKKENSQWVYVIPDDICFEEGKLNIFPVSGVPELQMFVLGMRSLKRLRVAIRQRACFDCCIKACKQAKINTLII
ncbi:hypothetical protein RRF57_006618 [Xylaria bambusicola]|uniref:Uncharacterized protein n=1 Tax=Xylaria bambusicola TaxID=326684 RepID=A0AAN7UQM3_9PEZI